MSNPPATLADIRRHVLDDASEITRTAGLATPMMEATFDDRTTEDQAVLRFLRLKLAQHLILVSLRLHETPRIGKTGHTASILALLSYGEREGKLSSSQTQAFIDERARIHTDLNQDGIPYEALVAFRDMEIAHSLHPHKKLDVLLAYSAVLSFARQTVWLVDDIDKTLVSTGLSRNFDPSAALAEWDARGAKYWRFDEDA